MKFALFSHVPWPEGTDPSRIFDETTEEIQYGEELGFYSAWLKVLRSMELFAKEVMPQFAS
jgi:hypothetical protein